MDCDREQVNILFRSIHIIGQNAISQYSSCAAQETDKSPVVLEEKLHKPTIWDGGYGSGKSDSEGVKKKYLDFFLVFKGPVLETCVGALIAVKDRQTLLIYPMISKSGYIENKSNFCSSKLC